MNLRIKQLARQAGGEFWQRIESDGVLNKEAYITFDPPESLAKFAELIVRECADISYEYDAPKMSGPGMIIAGRIETHFGIEDV